MQKNYTLPSGGQLTLNHLIVIPEPDISILTTDFYLNGHPFGEMVAYNGTLANLSKIKDCYELGMAIKKRKKYHYNHDDIFTIITDFKIKREYVFEKPTYYIFNKIFDFITDLGFKSDNQVYANILLIKTAVLDEKVEDIHRKLVLGLDAFVAL